MATALDLGTLKSEAAAKARARLREIEANKARYDADLRIFAADCLKIVPKEGGETLLRFNDVQRVVHYRLEEQLEKTGKVRALVLKARKPGVSTYVEARYYHKVSRRPGIRAFIMTHEQEATDTIFTMTERFHRSNPHAPKTGAANAKELYFSDLDSGFSVGTAGSKGIARGSTPQLFHGSEVAHWPNAAEHAAGALQSIANAPGTEIILESTANGSGGLFYNMCQQALRGEGDYILIFIPWFDHADYQTAPPEGWEPTSAWADYGQLHALDRHQLYWAYNQNAALAAADGASTEEPCWRFRQEFPATAEEAFRASREGAFIAADAVQRARKAQIPAQGHAVTVLGCDFATGGDNEGGDANVFIDRQARAAGRQVYERFRDGNTVSVASRLAAVIDRLNPAMVFMDTGGGGAAVHDILKARGYRNLTLVNFGSKALDNRKYANKRAEIWGELRDWLVDEGGAVIPDCDTLAMELTAMRAKEDMNQRILFRKKAEVRKEIGASPDGGDALATTFAETIRDADALARLDPLRGARGNTHGWLGS